MFKTFSRSGISFQYPENWTLEDEPSDHGWTVSLFSQDTAFLTIYHDERMPTLEQMADTTLTALKEEHKDVEHQEIIGQFAGQMSVGYDVQFFSFDLTCSSWIRSFFGPTGTYLLLWQMSDDDREICEPIMQAINKSMTIDPTEL